MKNINEIRKILNDYKNELRQRYNVKKIGIFGSYVRGDQKKTSDVDILVELNKPLGLEFINLIFYLEEILGVKVELVTKNAIKKKPRLLKSIKEDLIYI